ncbi:V-type ATPase subunit [Candidatus Woesearchaeota archaeon]|nr:V-type ATPase subunit [Candidatus Woesearchaeota archaeon]
MRSKLIKPIEYERLAKMRLMEMTQYLQEHEYKEEIDKLGLEYSGVELLENALRKNLVKVFNRLKTISNASTQVLIMQYLKRMDVWNVKTIIRGRYAKKSKEDIIKMLLPAGTLNSHDLNLLVRHESVKKILQSLKFINYSYLERGYEFYKKNNSLALIENLLDMHYYNDLLQFSRSLPEQGRVLKQFLEIEVDFLNIKNLIKSRALEIDLGEFMIYPGSRLQLKELVKLKDTSSLIKILKKSCYGRMLGSTLEAYHKKKDLAQIELEMDKFMYKKILDTPNIFPLSTDTILLYMFGKEIEIRNLLMLAKAKQMRMPESFIKENLIAG